MSLLLHIHSEVCADGAHLFPTPSRRGVAPPVGWMMAVRIRPGHGVEDMYLTWPGLVCICVKVDSEKKMVSLLLVGGGGRRRLSPGSLSCSWAERAEDGLVEGQGREAGWMGAARGKPCCCRRPL